MRGQLAVILGAISGVFRVDRTRIAPRTGLTAALPVAAMLALGTVLGQPVGAVLLGTGAMFVAMAWLGDGPAVPPLSTMAMASVVLAVATAVGGVTGRWELAHDAVLFLFCLFAGLATALGRRGAVVGTQALMAFIVFGRYPESVLGGLRLAGLVLGGGLAELLFVTLVATPLAWRRQRRALAEAYQRLADLAHGRVAVGVTSAEDLDAAERSLELPTLFGDPHLAGLITLLAEARRIRLELLVLSTTRAEGGEPAAALDRLGGALEQIAQTLLGADPRALAASERELKRWSDARQDMASTRVESQVAAVGGQVRAAARQAVAVAQGAAPGRWRLGRPAPGSPRLLADLRSDLTRLAENASLASVAGRHALRLAVVVVASEALSQHVGLPRAYWIPLTVATILRPGYAATFSRGAERAVGTIVGVVLASLIAVALEPSGWGTVTVIGCLAGLTFTVFPGTFAFGVAGMTAMVVFFLHTVSPGSVSIALDRGIDTVIGGAIGLGATVLWPTWSRASLPRDLARLLLAQARYLRAVLAGVLSGTGTPTDGVLALARSARVAYADADMALSVARGEPQARADTLGADRAAASLAALLRVSYGIHALRLVAPAADSSDRPDGAISPESRELGQPGLGRLAEGLGTALEQLGRQLQSGRAGPVALPPLRGLYRQCAGGLPGPLGLALDELVDAIDSAAAALER